VARWRKRDPIATFAARLERGGRLSAADREALDEKVREEIEAVVHWLGPQASGGDP